MPREIEIKSASPGLNSPAFGFAAVTPSDTGFITLNSNAQPCRALYIGGAGNVTVEDEFENECEFVAVPAGSVLPVVAYRVKEATTATSIVALF